MSSSLQHQFQERSHCCRDRRIPPRRSYPVSNDWNKMSRNHCRGPSTGGSGSEHGLVQYPEGAIRVSKRIDVEYDIGVGY